MKNKKLNGLMYMMIFLIAIGGALAFISDFTNDYTSGISAERFSIENGTYFLIDDTGGNVFINGTLPADIVPSDEAQLTSTSNMSFSNDGFIFSIDVNFTNTSDTFGTDDIGGFQVELYSDKFTEVYAYVDCGVSLNADGEYLLYAEFDDDNEDTEDYYYYEETSIPVVADGTLIMSHNATSNLTFCNFSIEGVGSVQLSNITNFAMVTNEYSLEILGELGNDAEPEENGTGTITMYWDNIAWDSFEGAANTPPVLTITSPEENTIVTDFVYINWTLVNTEGDTLPNGTATIYYDGSYYSNDTFAYDDTFISVNITDAPASVIDGYYTFNLTICENETADLYCGSDLVTIYLDNPNYTAATTSLSTMESALLGIGIIAGILGALLTLFNGFTLTSLITMLVGLIIFMVSLQFIH